MASKVVIISMDQVILEMSKKRAKELNMTYSAYIRTQILKEMGWK